MPRVLRMDLRQRAIYYCMPLGMLLLAGAELLEWPPTKTPRVAVALALASIVCIEWVIDRFMITLFDDRIVYRYLGFPFYLRREYSRASIVRARFVFPGPFSSMWRTQSLELTLKSPQGLRQATLVMRTFPPADVTAVIEWLQARVPLPIEIPRSW